MSNVKFQLTVAAADRHQSAAFDNFLGQSQHPKIVGQTGCGYVRVVASEKSELADLANLARKHGLKPEGWAYKEGLAYGGYTFTP